MNRKFGGGSNTGAGLLGAAPAQLNQFGGSNAMGQTAQMGMGGRSQMGRETQMRGGAQMRGDSLMRSGGQMGAQMGSGGQMGAQMGSGGQMGAQMGSGSQMGVQMRGGGQMGTQMGSAGQMGAQVGVRGQMGAQMGGVGQMGAQMGGTGQMGAQMGGGDVQPQKKRQPLANRGRGQKRRALLGDCPSYEGDVQDWSNSENKGRTLLDDPPSYEDANVQENWLKPEAKIRPLLDEPVSYEEGLQETWSYSENKNKGRALLGDAPGYEYDSQEEWSNSRNKGALLGDPSANEETEQEGWWSSENRGSTEFGTQAVYYEENIQEDWSQSGNRGQALLDDPHYYEDNGQEDWSQSGNRGQGLLGDAPVYGEDAQKNWLHSDNKRQALLGDQPKQVDWPNSEKPRPLLDDPSLYEDRTQNWANAEARGEALLGDPPVYENTTQEDWLQPRNRDQALLGDAPGYGKDVQEGWSHSKNRRQGLLGDQPVYDDGTQEDWPDSENKPRPLLDKPKPLLDDPSLYGDMTQENWSNTKTRGEALLGDPPSYEEDTHNGRFREEQGFTGGMQPRGKGPEPLRNQRPLRGQRPALPGKRTAAIQPRNEPTSGRKALLDDPLPYEEMPEAVYEEEHDYGVRGARQNPQQNQKRKPMPAKGRRPLLGDPPSYVDEKQVYEEEDANAGDTYYQRAAQQSGGRTGGPLQEQYPSERSDEPLSYEADAYTANYPEEEVNTGSGGMMNVGMQQRANTNLGQVSGMGRLGAGNQMGLDNQFGQGADNQMWAGKQMGMETQSRSSRQFASDRYVGDEFNDNRHSSGTGMGLLGSRPDEGLLGPGNLNERQVGNFMDPSNAQQSRGLSQQERAVVQQHQDRRMMQQRANNLMQQQQMQQSQQPLHSPPIGQQRMQQGMMGKGDGLLGEAPRAPLLSQPGRGMAVSNAGAIPSLFDVPGNRMQGKRPGDRVHRPLDKKPRREFSPERRRGQNKPDTRQERPDRRQQNRGTGQRQSRSDQSPSARKRDRRESETSRSSSSRRSDKQDSSAKDKKDAKGARDRDRSGAKPDRKTDRKVKTQITVTLDGDGTTDQYDPANPTADEEYMETEDEIKMNEEDVLELINKEEDEVMFVKEEKGKDGSKVDKPKDESAQSGTIDLTTETDGKEEKPKEVGLTVTVSKHKKGRSVADPEGTAKPEEKKKYHCNVCNVNCFSETSFGNHMSGQKHLKMMESVMKVTEERSHQIAARIKAQSHLRKIESSSTPVAARKDSDKKVPVGKALESHCKTCDKKFTGAYRDHKETPEHKDRESRRRAGCKICSISSFSNYNIYTSHLKSDMHIKNSFPHCNLCKQWFKSPRKFVQHCKTEHHLKNKRKRDNREDDSIDMDEMSELVTLDVVGFEDDTTVDKVEDMDVTQDDNKSKSTTMNLEPLTPMLSKAQATSTPKQSVMKPPGREEQIAIPEEFDPDQAVGQDYVIPVSGFFCKLCHKFYNNETAAKTAHCQSEPHFEKYKKAMVAKAYSQKLKEEATGPKVTSSLTFDQSSSIAKNTEESNATEASNYHTADEQQDSTVEKTTESTIQKTTESSQESLKSPDKQLPNGSTVEVTQEEESKSETEDLSQDGGEGDIVVKNVERGRGATGARGAMRNKARRARKF